MFKKVIFLIVLSSILLALVLFKANTADPVNGSLSSYTMVEYKITDIKGDQYYGKGNDGTEISFSDKNISSGDKIQVDDEVICYFQKDNFGKGLVKVEKK